MAQQAFIQFDKVSKEYGSGDRHFYALKDATFSIQQGEMVVILGPSGAGKSTLIKIIMGNVLVDKGEVYRNNKFKVVCLDQHAEINMDCTIKEYLAGAYADLFKLEEKLSNIGASISRVTVD